MLAGETHAVQEEEDEVVIARTATEEVTVQVMLDDGFWHREADWQTTACDLPIRKPIDRRPKRYEGRLCRCGCWSQSELDRAAASNVVDMEERETGEFDRLEFDDEGRAVPPTLTSVSARQQRKSARIEQKLLEIKNQRKDKP